MPDRLSQAISAGARRDRRVAADEIRIAIIGGGPAGLAAAERLVEAGRGNLAIHIFDAMPSFGRKLLLAGRSGLNLSHAEPIELFLDRFGNARASLEPAIRDFDATAIRHWAARLGIATFVGSSGRIFPAGQPATTPADRLPDGAHDPDAQTHATRHGDHGERPVTGSRRTQNPGILSDAGGNPRNTKATPLLRAWLRRLQEAGVTLHAGHRWTGWDGTGALTFTTPAGAATWHCDAALIALGGASWPRLGSTGEWTRMLAARGIRIEPLRPANCGFDVAWTSVFRERFAGTPVKSVVLAFGDQERRGDLAITRHGIEGSPVYGLGAALRDGLATSKAVHLLLDLAPDQPLARIAASLGRPRGGASLTNHLRKRTGLAPVKIALLRERLDQATLANPNALASAIKCLPLPLERPRPLAEAISTAGGVALAELDERWMLRQLPGVFAAGEMIDWEAPTGGYLLTACLATGRAAAAGMLAWLDECETG